MTATFAKEILPVNLEDEMRKSYLDYAMSVIVGRALPDVRDGLKPVHRRVLFAMSELGNEWNKPYKKSARIVGDVIGKYHPHGDTAVYDTAVRMAQPFSLRYMLIDGQGNFGSVDGDAPAAMRYTEIRMSKIAHELQLDIDKETVDFVPNYDGNEREPSVFPTRLPNLLINGSSGIAVGMATNIPPHNLTETVNACLALLADPDMDISDLMTYLPGPDFPTAGIINGARGIREAYRTGKGRIYVRARAEIEVDSRTSRETIIVTELPYQVNKARLLEKIAELVKEKKLEGISELRDESDKDGMRMVIELKRGESGEVILNNLYKQTQMQSVFGINMVALVDGQPRLLNLKEVLEAFLRHRREVVTRRTIFEVRKARERAHILEGLAIALSNIDEIIDLIKAAPSPADAKIGLLARAWNPGIVTDMLTRSGADTCRPDDLPAQYGIHPDGYWLSEVQAQAILDLRLHRLTGLEKDKILAEYRELLDKIADLLEILANPDRLIQVIRDELLLVRDTYGDKRRTEINVVGEDLSMEDLIADEEVMVTLSHAGYAKAQTLDTYRAQKRGGRGKAATAMKDEDFIEKLFVASMHDTLLCFSSRGRMYWLKVYQLPMGGRGARGKPMVNLLPLEEGERINAVLPIREYAEDKYIFMATSEGTVKKTPLTEFSRPRTAGIIAVDLRDGDKLVDVAVTNGDNDVMLFSTSGKAIRFHESDVRAMGRTAAGVRGIRMDDGQEVNALIIVGEGELLIATENGYGKRTRVDEFSAQGRGGQGVIAIQTSERNGNAVGAVQVKDECQIMLITDGGTLVRTPVADVSIVGRNTQGVTLIRLNEGEKLVQIAPILTDSNEDSLEETAEE
ncbi:MAG TPA: DNA gyrase subunit A [Candidatus Thiothrix moscowensis]|uniref:DNA gyrase subunit A n=1 Tax=unclassified Thiothrix TaxID=2636184 RepID=UPI001A29F569|nr:MULTISPECIES: DNA gyrase subunit A [unclassified Thiothrix]MBJ6611633.1 DNA gyrase subunit A [Candidatus Thiothrix moscowensis]HRJ53733.1 DNA gyrase subunit A [Candidatus Thiothrix moscowensis]HRJ93815.1 DNA gyrase subunit A [Candidatus Thiothrix moscowensis]